MDMAQASKNCSSSSSSSSSSSRANRAAVAEEGESWVVPKGILQSEALLQYILETSVYPKETPEQREMREYSLSCPNGSISSTGDAAHFLMMLLKLMRAKNTIEVGVFAGYSLLCTALALPPDGKIVAIDVSRENYDKGRPIIEKAGVAHKIDFKHGDALEIIDDMIYKKEIEEDSLDFAFVDADKKKNAVFHEKLIKLVKVGGVIAYDNTLWYGCLVDDESHPARKFQEYESNRQFIKDFNNALVTDKRVEICQISIGDGITLCRRIL